MLEDYIPAISDNWFAFKLFCISSSFIRCWIALDITTKSHPLIIFMISKWSWKDIGKFRHNKLFAKVKKTYWKIYEVIKQIGIKYKKRLHNSSKKI